MFVSDTPALCLKVHLSPLSADALRCSCLLRTMLLMQTLCTASDLGGWCSRNGAEDATILLRRLDGATRISLLRELHAMHAFISGQGAALEAVHGLQRRV